eukprot:5653927-Prymnesium_polylepis.1
MAVRCGGRDGVRGGSDGRLGSDGGGVRALRQAMGVTSDQEIVQLIGSEGPFVQAIAASLNECSQLRVYSQRQ